MLILSLCRNTNNSPDTADSSVVLPKRNTHIYCDTVATHKQFKAIKNVKTKLVKTIALGIMPLSHVVLRNLLDSKNESG